MRDDVLDERRFARAFFGWRQLKRRQEIRIAQVSIRPRIRCFARIVPRIVEQERFGVAVGEVHADSNIHPKPSSSRVEARAVRIGELDEAARLVAGRRAVSISAVAGPVSSSTITDASGTRSIPGAGALSSDGNVPNGFSMREFRRFRAGRTDAVDDFRARLSAGRGVTDYLRFGRRERARMTDDARGRRFWSRRRRGGNARDGHVRHDLALRLTARQRRRDQAGEHFV